jgi:hypothetical protein
MEGMTKFTRLQGPRRGGLISLWLYKNITSYGIEKIYVFTPHILL